MPYQDEAHGSLLIMADRIIDLIYLKYFKAAVSYYKETLAETYPFVRDAVREAVYNALIHCNWADNHVDGSFAEHVQALLNVLAFHPAPILLKMNIKEPMDSTDHSILA